MPLRILHLEDDSNDCELVAETLLADGFECAITRVASLAEYLRELARTPDLILSDYALPGFDGATAQELAQQLCPGVPFLFVSGSLGEDVAVERVKAGATDYVLKHRLERLPTAVRRAIQEVQNTRAKDFLEELVARSPSMIFRVDAQHQRAIYVSPNVAWLLGYSVSEVLEVATLWEFLIHPDDRARLVASIQRATNQPLEPLGDEYRFRRQDGEYRWFFTLLRVECKDGEARTILGYALDVNDRKAAEEALQQAQEEAVAARRDAERANRAKSEFLSRMSHDLRTPLHSILGFAQVLELDQLSPEQADHVAQILGAGKHLLDLINEVLDIARIEAGHLSLSSEPVSLPEVAQDCLNIVRPLAAQRHISLFCSHPNTGPPFACADRQRLRQVVINLLSNAVKYNRQGGTVTVSCAELGDGTAALAVTDTGAGIPPEKMALLFAPFERLGAEQSGIEGTGLGLALSKALTEAMGGQLRVTSVIDRGSTFTVGLPAGRDLLAAETVEPRPDEDVAAAEAGVVLYVEDNLQNVRLMQRLLARRPGVRLAHTATGLDGLTFIRRHRPPLVLLDLHLPDMHGDDVLRKVWEDPVTRGTAVVILSADATPAEHRRLLASGAHSYITKPFDVREVLRVVDEVLGAKSA